MLPEWQIAHLEQNQDKFDKFYTEHKPVREYLDENEGEFSDDPYLLLCGDLGIEPLDDEGEIVPELAKAAAKFRSV